MTDPGQTTNFDQSTWLAHRALDAQTLPPAKITHVALPGAKQAIEHDRLRAYQAAGHDQHAIVQRVNERWHAQHAQRLAGHRRWVAGPYAGAIEELRRIEAEKAAEELRRRALFESLIAEREARDAGDA